MHNDFFVVFPLYGIQAFKILQMKNYSHADCLFLLFSLFCTLTISLSFVSIDMLKYDDTVTISQ